MCLVGNSAFFFIDGMDWNFRYLYHYGYLWLEWLVDRRIECRLNGRLVLGWWVESLIMSTSDVFDT